MWPLNEEAHLIRKRDHQNWTWELIGTGIGTVMGTILMFATMNPDQDDNSISPFLPIFVGIGGLIISVTLKKKCQPKNYEASSEAIDTLGQTVLPLVPEIKEPLVLVQPLNEENIKAINTLGQVVTPSNLGNKTPRVSPLV